MLFVELNAIITILSYHFHMFSSSCLVLKLIAILLSLTFNSYETILKEIVSRTKLTENGDRGRREDKRG